MKSLGVLEIKWDPIRKKLVIRLLEEQDKGATVLVRTKGRDAEQGGGQEQLQGPGTCPIGHACVKMARADLGQVPNFRFSGERGNRRCFVCRIFSLAMLDVHSGGPGEEGK
jgi:hypothetical protein